MVIVDRRLETQRLCTLGRAWMSWGERDERFRSAALRYLTVYITRETDRQALAGTPWAVPEPAGAPAAVEPAGEAEHVG